MLALAGDLQTRLLHGLHQGGAIRDTPALDAGDQVIGEDLPGVFRPASPTAPLTGFPVGVETLLQDLRPRRIVRPRPAVLVVLPIPERPEGLLPPRRPVRRGKHWMQVEDPKRYDKITDQLLVETFFPVSAVRQRRALIHRANKVLETLKEAGELRVVDNRILPPKVILTDE